MQPGSAGPDAYYRKGLPATIVITVLFALFAAFFAFGQGGFGSTRSGVLNIAALLFSCLIIFMSFHKGRVYLWRRVFFTTYAVCFALSFVWWTMGDRGHMWLLDAETLYSQAPMCHIVVPMLILPIVFTRELIFPASFAGAALMILVVGVIGVVYGRGCVRGAASTGDRTNSSLPCRGPGSRL